MLSQAITTQMMGGHNRQIGPYWAYLRNAPGLRTVPRTVPVRSAWADRGALQKPGAFRPDNPLRTGTVRGPAGPVQIRPPLFLAIAETFLKFPQPAFLALVYPG